MKRLLVFLFLFEISETNGQSSDFVDFDFQRADSIAAIYTGYDLSKEKQLVELLTKDLSLGLD